MARRYYSSTATATTLSSGITAGATSFTVGSTAGWPTSYPFTLILDVDTASEEVVSVTNVSGTTVTATRGQDGTTGVEHSAGATVKHGVSARDFDEPNAHIQEGDGDNPHGLPDAAWDGGGAWTSWTPTFSGFTLGNGTAAAYYKQVGKTVHWNLVVTAGSTSAATASTATFTLPVTAARGSVGAGVQLSLLFVLVTVVCTTTTASPVEMNNTARYVLGTSATIAPSEGYTYTFSGTFEAA